MISNEKFMETHLYAFTENPLLSSGVKQPSGSSILNDDPSLSEQLFENVFKLQRIKRKLYIIQLLMLEWAEKSTTKCCKFTVRKCGNEHM